MNDDGKNLERERWFRQLVAAVRLNARDLALWECALEYDEEQFGPRSPGEAAKRAGALIERTLPYRFSGAERILEFAACRRRGHAACGDAAAAISSVVLMAGGVPSLCYEKTDALPGYAHVRVGVGEIFVDPYAERSLDVDRCSASVVLTPARVGWPADVDAADAWDALTARRRRRSVRVE